MKIDVYRTLTSVRPFTSWRSYADMANFLEENGEIATICKKIDETGNKELKSGLPLMMPMGDVGDKTRSKENAEPTGLVMIDIDSPDRIEMEDLKRHFGQEEMTQDIYLRVLSRPARDNEVRSVREWAAGVRKGGMKLTNRDIAESLVWALLNTDEFLFLR